MSQMLPTMPPHIATARTTTPMGSDGARTSGCAAVAAADGSGGQRGYRRCWAGPSCGRLLTLLLLGVMIGAGPAHGAGPTPRQRSAATKKTTAEASRGAAGPPPGPGPSARNDDAEGSVRGRTSNVSPPPPRSLKFPSLTPTRALSTGNLTDWPTPCDPPASLSSQVNITALLLKKD